MSFPRYPAYKDSGVEWLGEVPEHWNRTALKFLADYQNGYPFKPDERGETGLPIIRISQLTGDDEPAYYSGTLDERVKVRNGDLLFSWSATIDSYIWNKGEAWLNQHIFRVSPSKEADKRYLYYAIKHVAPKLADFDAHGSTMRHIKKESLGEKIYVPLVFDQGLIATFLDRETAKIDALIAEQQRLIELLQEKRQAVISHAVTKGLNPDAPMKDSGVEWLGEVPEHWTITRLGRITLARCDGPFGSGLKSEHYVDSGVLVVRLQNIKSTGYDSTVSAFIDLQYYSERLGDHDVEPGDLLIAGLGDDNNHVGRACVAPYDLGAAMVKADCFRFRLAAEVAIPEFIASSLNTSAPFHGGTLSSGSTRSRIPLSMMASREVALPPLEEQMEILSEIKSKLSAVDQLKREGEEAIGLLQERRSALISAAVTGQIDVRGLVPDAGAA
jgi:type I restriction enzyme S subunit